MATIGELSDIGVLDLIDVMTRRGRTGRLAVKIAGQEVHLHFRDGRLILVTSTDITLRLGRMLIRQGLIDTPRLLEALHLQAEAGHRRPLGEILIERGWITEADLTRCIEEQSVEALARVVTDQPGVFVFEAFAPAPAAADAVPLDLGLLLRAAQERTDGLRMLREQLPSPGTPLFLNADVKNAVRDDPHSPEAMVAGVLRTGARSYAELSFHLALDELTLGVAVLTLIEAGVIVTGAGSTMSNGRTVLRAVAG